jgi:hypothetical protein
VRFHLPLAISHFQTAFVKGMPIGACDGRMPISACDGRMPQPVLTCASVVVQLVTSVDGKPDGGNAILTGISAAFVFKFYAFHPEVFTKYIG